MAATRHIILLTLVLLVLVSFACGRGARGGGFRGGGFRGGSSYRGSSYRGSSYRSSIYGGSSRRSGNYYSSSYIKYTPSVRYSRVYTSSYNNFYFTYYNLYFYHSGTYVYLHRSRAPDDSRVCANYEANDNGTTMGVFTCPNSWEPADFIYCCGEDYAEYCCREKPGLNYGEIIGIMIGLVALAFILFTLVRLCKSCGPCPKPRIRIPRSNLSRPKTHQEASVTEAPAAPLDLGRCLREQPPPYEQGSYRAPPTVENNNIKSALPYTIPVSWNETGDTVPHQPAPQASMEQFRTTSV